MSFLKKAFASIGIGSAKVDTHVFNPDVRAGEQINGEIQIAGGNLEQKIDKIYLELRTTYVVEREDSKYTNTYTIVRADVCDSFVLAPGEKRSLPFSFIIPYITPLAIMRKQVWIHTGLDIENAIDPSDRDYLNIQPTVSTQIVLEAIQGQLGMRLREIETEAGRLLGNGIPFVQEFEFVPTNAFRGHLDELEVVFVPYTGGIDVLLEVDKKARSLRGLIEEATGMDERKIRVSFNNEQLSAGSGYIAQEIANVIESCIR